MNENYQHWDLDEVVGRLDDRDPAIRQSAATYCAVMGDRAVSARQALITHLYDPEMTVRISIAEALYHMGEIQRSLKAINESLQHHDPCIRLQALYVLRTFGYDVTPALRLARKMIDNNSTRND
jgi:N-sulfoglucosamine sulfohydrolase